VRVPAQDFDDLLVAVGRVGEVEQRSITSEDVSDEYVDLEARLRHNQAQERFYLSLLDRAEDVDDAIAVQQRVEGIQQTIEQIEGRLRFLDERTSFSRLTVELFEAGGAFQGSGTPEPTFARYWATARAALINVLGGALVVATVALPFVVAGAVVLLVVRRYGLPRRRAAAPDA
jgi:Flp pilus assembly protein TadB